MYKEKQNKNKYKIEVILNDIFTRPCPQLIDFLWHGSGSNPRTVYRGLVLQKGTLGQEYFLPATVLHLSVTRTEVCI